jgi:DNA-binding NarL/FixJ family response regulator
VTERAVPTILIVDDTPQNVRLLEFLLPPSDYSLRWARNGEEALRAVEGERPDLILLDVVMPGMDGFEVCARLRADPSANMLPIVMITANDVQDRIRAIEAGADDFIHTPYESSELKARVKSLLRIRAYQETIETQAEKLAEWSQTLEARVDEQLGHIQRLEQLRRFLAPQLADLVLSSGDEGILESHRRDIAVLKCGLRGFAAFGETAEPEEVLDILHQFHEALAELVFQYEGTLHRFAAERLTVLFNDPLPCPDGAQRSVHLALDMRDRVRDLSGAWRKLGHQLDFVVGIAMGYATLGRIGVEQRFDYEAVGTVMDLAEGLAHAAGPGQILIGQRVLARVGNEFQTEFVGDLQIAEFAHPMPTHAVIARKRPVQPPKPADEKLVLTAREREVAGLIARGCSNADIANELVIAPGTAANHVQHILDKLGFDNRAQIAAWAAEHGIVAALSD